MVERGPLAVIGERDVLERHIVDPIERPFTRHRPGALVACLLLEQRLAVRRADVHSLICALQGLPVGQRPDTDQNDRTQRANRVAPTL